MIQKALLLMIFIYLSGCSSIPTPNQGTPFHTIAGSVIGYSFEKDDIKVISDHKIGTQQIRVVRHNNDSCVSGYQDYIELNGAINRDSSLILERVLKNIVKCKTDSDITSVTPIYMNSMGGSVRDGLMIGRIFKKYGVYANITKGQTCASSCAFAYLGAEFRLMTHDSKLLFHSPYNNVISGIKCANKEDGKWLKDYYIEMIGTVNGVLLYDRTMDYCSKENGWVVNSDTAKIFGITKIMPIQSII